MNKIIFLIFTIFSSALSAESIPAVTIADSVGSQTYSVSLQIIAIMTVLALLPAILLAMTSFTRVIIVLGILRQALGMPQTPSNQILIGIALFLTFFIMSPVYQKINHVSLTPYMSGKIEFKPAIERAMVPIKDFMLSQTREKELAVFGNMTNFSLEDDQKIAEVPFSVLMPAFITSELKTAFQIGFLLFIPFLIIDLVVASVLMAMGMMMLSPLIISLPFKIMLFILVDGWTLVVGTLASSFR